MSKVAKRNRMVKIFCVILMVCMFLSVANVAFGETTIDSITGGGANLGEQGNELVKTIVSWLTGDHADAFDIDVDLIDAHTCKFFNFILHVADQIVCYC